MKRFIMKSIITMLSQAFALTSSAQSTVPGQTATEEQDTTSIQLYYEKGEERHNKGDYPGAQIHYNTAIQKAKELHGDNNKYLAICYELYGDNYFEWKVWGNSSLLNYGDAKTYYNMSLNCWTSLSGDNNHDIARLNNKIGACWLNLENDEEAMKKFEQALSILQNSGEENPLLLASIYDNMANTAAMRQDWGTALKHYNAEYNELYTKHLDVGGLDNKKIANCLFNTGKVKAKLQMSPVASYEESLKFHRAAGGLTNDVALVFLEMVKYYYSIGDYNKTMESLKKMLIVEEHLYGKESEDYKQVQSLIEKLEKEMNQQ